MEDELSHSGQEIVKAMMSLEVVPYFPVEQLDKQRAVKLPLAELALAGRARQHVRNLQDGHPDHQHPERWPLPLRQQGLGRPRRSDEGR